MNKDTSISGLRGYACRVNWGNHSNEWEGRDRMQPYFQCYQTVKNWYEANILTQQKSLDQMQLAHEFVLKTTFDIAFKEMIAENGPPPCEFSWFVMGSASRGEQAVFSDQDHGIIYEAEGASIASYFLGFGQKLSSALHRVGYPKCDGNVMSSNPVWCKSVRNWEVQIEKWMTENTWELFRYLLIFLDARVVVGDENQMRSMKRIVYEKIRKQPAIILRLFENTKYIEKGLGLFNQFLTVSSGPYSGQINIKNTAIFPYVNAIRLLAIMEEIEATSTLKRMEALRLHHQNMATHHTNFNKLLQYRLLYGDAKSYEDVAYLKVERLNKREKLELKHIYKDIEILQKFTEMMVQGAMENE